MWGCLAIGPPNAFNQRGVTVFVASISGILRVFLLHGEGQAVNNFIWESDLKLPVIQIEFGWFGEGGDEASIVILHPHELVICTLQVDEAAARNNLLHLLPLKIHRFTATGGEISGVSVL